MSGSEPGTGTGAPRWPLVTASEMRALDRHTIESLGVPGDLLMESAGRAVAQEVLHSLDPDAEVVIVCGKGNNGGDGLVASRHLQLLGVRVRVALLAEPSRLVGDAAQNWQRARAAGVAIEGHHWSPPNSGVVVDAVFGTGLSRVVEGEAAEALARINACRQAGRVAILAVDLPSGLCADTGAVLGTAVVADTTLTLGLPKLGLALEPARSHAGLVRVARIGIADSTPDVTPGAELWTSATTGQNLPVRVRAGHKGTFGHALIVAGSEGKTGAAALAAMGAARSGAGRVTLACPAGLNDILEIKCTEAMTAPVPDTPQRSFAASAIEAVVAMAANRGAVGVGPGLGRSIETQQFVTELVKRLELPLVIDADGLFPLASELGLLAARTAPTLLTPHPGEAAHLLGVEVSDINRDRPGMARRLAEQAGAIVALKGAATAIAAPDGRLAINPTGGPALAAGGTGDVLLGMVTALLVQGLAPFEAMVAAVFVHGAAADRLAEHSGSSGMLASDLASELPDTMRRLRACADNAPATFSRSPLVATRGTVPPVGGLAVSFPEP